MNKPIIVCIVLSVFCIQHTTLASYNFEACFTENGFIEYTSDFKQNSENDMYVAIYDENSVSIKILKNKPNGTIDVNTSKKYYAAAYFWTKNLFPVCEHITVDSLSADSHYTTSTLTPNKYNSMQMLDANQLTNSDGEHIELDNTLYPSDTNASAQTISIYRYLKAVGKSKQILFGHQNDITHKAGSEMLSESDIYDITYDYSALCGFDTLSLTGDEYSAWQCNKTYGTHFSDTTFGNISALAYVSNKAISNGALITLSAHMPDFSKITKKAGSYDKTYDSYDFSGYSSDITNSDYDAVTASEILPGGSCNEVYRAYLDMIAEYSLMVDSTILFRPFHEGTGSWFWWGIKTCDNNTYKEIYQYTVNYLRNEKNVHNMLYVYSPSDTASNESNYVERYPGDAFTDILSVDMYERNSEGSSQWLNKMQIQLNILSSLADKHNKIISVAETGVFHDTIAGDTQTALLRYGNENKDWFKVIWYNTKDYPVSYITVWSNWSETNSFYTPYVKKINADNSLYGHEMIDEFIDFYNISESVFAADQINIFN